MRIVTNATELKNAEMHIYQHAVWYVDTEGTNLDPRENMLLLVQLLAGDELFIFDMTLLDHVQFYKMFVRGWTSPRITKVMQNARYDIKVLLHTFGKNEDPKRHLPRNVYDTLFTEKLLFAGIKQGYGLDDIVLRRLKRTLDKSVRKTFTDFGGSFSQEQLEYAAQDVLVLPHIYQQQCQELQTKNLALVHKDEMSLVPVVALMEYTGMLVDRQYLDDLKPIFEAKIKAANNALQNLFINAGIADEIVFTKDGYYCVNLSSPKQVLEMFHKVGITLPNLNAKTVVKWDFDHRKGAKKYQIDFNEYFDEDGEFVENFGSLENNYLRAYSYFVALNKLYSTYIVGLPEHIASDGRIHSNYDQLGTTTGRFASKQPNLQNIPQNTKLAALGIDKSIRAAFIAKDRNVLINCVNAESLVATKNGMTKARDVRQGDLVTQEDGTFREVLRTYDNGVRDTLTVTTELGFEITVTPEHRIRIIDNAGNYIWRDAQSLKIGDYVAIQPTHHFNNVFQRLCVLKNTHFNTKSMPESFVVDELFAELFGYLVGDGNFNDRGIKLVVNDQDDDLLSYLKNSTSLIFRQPTAMRHYRGVYEFGVSSVELGSMFRFIQAKDHIPEIIWNSPKEVQQAFLRGYFEADGSISIHKGTSVISISSARKKIMQDTQLMLLNLGIYSKLRKQIFQLGTVWQLTIYEQSNKLFMETVGFLSERKRSKFIDKVHVKSHFRYFPNKKISPPDKADHFRLRNHRNLNRNISWDVATTLNNSYGMDYFIVHGQVYTQITDITKSCNHVVDFTIEDTHTYICNGFVNHNCDYSGIELVIIADASGDDTLMEHLEDPHIYVAQHVLGCADISQENKKQDPYKHWRQGAKRVSYSIAYGVGGKSLAEQLTLDLSPLNIKYSPTDGDKFIRLWKQTFPKAGKWLDKNAHDVLQLGVITDGIGRKRFWDMKYIQSHPSAKWLLLAAQREASNFPVQSLSAHMTKLAMILTHEELDLRRGRIISCVHDEIIVEASSQYAPEAAHILKKNMEQAARMVLKHLGNYVIVQPEISERYEK